MQEALDGYRCVMCLQPSFTPAIARLIVQRLQERLGTVEVLLERVDEVPRERNGKFRAVLCNLPAAEREHLGKADQ